jgi:hypothetical protein
MLRNSFRLNAMGMHIAKEVEQAAQERLALAGQENPDATTGSLEGVSQKLELVPPGG